MLFCLPLTLPCHCVLTLPRFGALHCPLVEGLQRRRAFGYPILPHSKTRRTAIGTGSDGLAAIEQGRCNWGTAGHEWSRMMGQMLVCMIPDAKQIVPGGTHPPTHTHTHSGP